jgi:hypothetical protein
MSYLEQRRNYINAGRPLPEKKIHTIKKVSDKRAAKIKEQKELGTDKELDHFFNAMRKKCKGKCTFCGSGTTYKNEELWRIAIAHLLEKSKFKSVATHEKNWIELCWSCHRSFDDGKISWLLLKDSKEWETLKEQLLEVLPLVAENERSHKLYNKLIELVYEKGGGGTKPGAQKRNKSKYL